MQTSTRHAAATLGQGLDGLVRQLPPLRDRDRATFTPAQRTGLVVLIVAAHGALGWGLLQLHSVRETGADIAPLFVDWLAPRIETPPPLPPPPPPPRPVPKLAPPPPPLLSTAPAPQPAPFVVEPAIVPEPVPEPPAPVVVDAAPAPPARAPEPAPAPPAPPKTLPASAVQYLEPPVLEYPRASRRAGESGRVLVRVYIDETGAPRQEQISQSSGFARLDDAALAAVHKARFKPYSENGRPMAGWAFIPLAFDLER
jgi:periplasmic protein TonB